jgi:hypothetical protein
VNHADFPWFSLIPVVAIVGGLIIGGIAIVTEHRRKQALLEERRLMIEKGMTPPPLNEQVLEGAAVPGSSTSVESSLRTGIITTFVGLGLLAAFAAMRLFVVGAPGRFLSGHVISLLAPAGALVTLIGLGNLLYFWIASRRTGTR